MAGGFIQKQPRKKDGSKILRPSKVSAKVSDSVKQYVKRRIDANIENKLAIYQLPAFGIGVTTSLVQPTTVNLLPLIYQGQEVCDRNGNKVRQKKTIVRFALARNGTTPTTSLQMTYIVIARLRNTTDTPALSDCNLIKYQNSSSGVIVNSGMYSLDPETFISPFNEDVWDIKKVIKLKIGASNSTPQNNDYHMSATVNVDLTKYLKKVWSYANAANNYPENEGLYALFYNFNIDGISAHQNQIQVDGVIECRFEDA